MAPETLATVLILVSALLHAVVNAMVKVSGDPLLTRGCMNATALAVAAPFAFFVPWPAADLWPVLFLAMLVHGLYPFFLVGAYRHGDLSAAFPVARGTAPLGVLVLAAAWAAEPLTLTRLACIALISAGVASFALERNALSTASRRKGLELALTTGIIIAIYTVIDGIGLRISATKMTYIVWLFVLDGFFVSTAVGIVRRRALPGFLRTAWRPALAGGVLGVMTYGMALYALGLGPIAEIAALRETSIVFAALIGAAFLGEPFGRQRLLASLLVAAGVVTLQATR